MAEETSKAPADKATAAKTTAPKTTAAKATTTKATAAKTAATKTTAAKASTAKATATKTAATKTAAAKTTTAKTSAKAPAKTAATKTTTAKAAPKATAAKKATTTKAATAKTSTAAKTTATKTAAAKTTAAKTTATAKKATTTKATAEPKPAAKATTAKAAPKAAEPKAAPKAAPKAELKAAPKAAPKATPKAEPKPEPVEEPKPVVAPEPEPELPQPRRSVAFIGSECYPFVKTGGLGDVMYALPKALVAQNIDVKVILPKYACIKQEYKDKMVYRGAFDMDLTADGRRFYVGIMEYVWDGVVYDFIDNEEFFTSGNPYTNLVDDIPKFCFFGKAALAALNYLDWIPDVIHCHDWQAGLVPVYLRTMFNDTPLSRSKVVTTIHNLRFQGKYDIPTLKYWSNLPDSAFNMGALQEQWTEANMLKGGLAYSDMITTVSSTYAGEIQTWEYGENLDAHLRHHSYKLRGIVNGIDVDIWNPATDELLEEPYSVANAIEKKKANKLALQKELGLEQDEGKFVIGLISRLTNQKGLDLVSAVAPGLIDGFTQIVILGTGDTEYENAFRQLENNNKGTVCSYIAYDEALSHKIYASCDVLLVPSKFEPCGLTQLIAMRYGTIPVVRETGGLKDTVQPYNQFDNDGNGFTFDRYEAGLLWDAINRAKTLYFENRWCWDQMVQRDMEKDVSWQKSAEQYRWLYLELTQ